MGFPFLPGVPALLNYSQVVGAAADVVIISNLFKAGSNAVWGIFDATANVEVLKPDNFISVEFKKEMNISNYPIEQGAFNSYNKVRTPFSIILKISKGSSVGIATTNSTVSDRDTFLNELDSLLASNMLFTIVTPEASYSNVNLEEYDFRRELQNGAGMIIASLRFVEIMQATTLISKSSYTAVAPDSTATVASAQSSINLGMIQLGNAYKPSTPIM
jgi:hypothetical protein